MDSVRFQVDQEHRVADRKERGDQLRSFRIRNTAAIHICDGGQVSRRREGHFRQNDRKRGGDKRRTLSAGSKHVSNTCTREAKGGPAIRMDERYTCL
jgi:hypothetical protein